MRPESAGCHGTAFQKKDKGNPAEKWMMNHAERPHIDELPGKAVTGMGRASELLWLGIGEEINVFNGLKKQEQKKSEYAIHFQCHWRFRQGEKMLVASGDLFTPYDESLDDDSWEWDVLGREEAKSSRFDVLAAECNTTVFPLRITEISMRGTGDLHIGFERNIDFDTFIDCSAKREFFRLIDFTTGGHMVVYDTFSG